MNLFENIPDSVPDELVTILTRGSNFRVERIVSTGHVSPDGFWYDQDEHEWVLLLSGAATLEIVNDSSAMQPDEASREVIAMKPGDHITLPARQRHRVAWTTEKEPTVWLAVFYQV